MRLKEKLEKVPEESKVSCESCAHRIPTFLMARVIAFGLLWLLSFHHTNAALNGTNTTYLRHPNNGTALYPPLFELHSNSTPRFINTTGRTANPLIKVLQDKNQNDRKRSLFGFSPSKRSHHGSHARFHHSKRDDGDDWTLPEGTCAPGTPCVNGACCSNKGICGFSPAECGTSNCISNCNATAPCGQYAKEEDKQCPLNVCCSFYGFCGATDLFCTTGGEHPCQEGYGSCGDAPRPSCDGGDSTSGRVIGYYEGW